MKRTILALALAALAAPALAAEKTYQVTGPVLEVSNDSITVQKGKEKWQLARSAETQVSGGDPKKGDKVTIQYTMTATKIEVKPEKSAKTSKAKK
jgi:cytochrome c1